MQQISRNYLLEIVNINEILRQRSANATITKICC